MAKRMRAKYAGGCVLTGRGFGPGDLIDYLGKGRGAVLIAYPDEHGRLPDGLDHGHKTREQSKLDAERQALPWGASWGALARDSGTVSDVITMGGKEYYRNKGGRCEDAPCCGCCTI